jgi:hypothetical protein
MQPGCIIYYASIIYPIKSLSRIITLFHRSSASRLRYFEREKSIPNVTCVPCVTDQRDWRYLRYLRPSRQMQLASLAL